MDSQLNDIEKLIKNKSTLETLAILAKEFPDRVVFSTSFGLEDQVITHFIFSNNLLIKVFTLDTGRFFPETYSVWNRTLERYKKEIKVYFPNSSSVEHLLKTKGPLSFYESVENRKECCYIRKVEPLSRALKEKNIWITGIRKEQSANRNTMNNIEWDEQHQLIKYHPLFDWDIAQVKAFIKDNNISHNTLHTKGFPSIGCQPCTRAIREGEDERAGRWWWENNSKKECGLHTH